ncbi:MAG: CDP-diacylglycerol--glycerol-3-phosphate 3-phosphatidyltransferase [Oscillospiraceae bacterium]|jgi:CDP-diacylglycerol--glycerol-3-phosphate 3-phosphatidyltransferase|nr:CDP-diacylglycerol--glycerol-3-phosphate 3-phosphatidyltransferase [Oscillospiraceae bacterium]
MNTANKLTLFRVAMIPLLLIVLYWGFSYSAYVAALIFVIASVTDFIDGYIARSRGQVTDFGKFLDPLADKVLVFAAMMWFTAEGVMPAWATLVVIMREFAVTGLRLVAVSGGKVIAAAWSGKVKTAATMSCITLMFFTEEFTVWFPGLPGQTDRYVAGVCVGIILVTTLYSGAEYFVKNRKCIDFKK